MTIPSTEPLGLLLEEMRALRTSVENGIDQARIATQDVQNLRDDMVRIENKSDRRALAFRIMWSVLAAAFIAGAVVVTINYTSDQHKRACFQTWANDTASRTQLLSNASDTRIHALNTALDALSQDKPAATIQLTIALAARAGDAYEQLAQENPPVPSLEIECQVSAPTPTHSHHS